MKTKLHELLRWVLAPILAACLLAWFVTPAYPKDTKPKVPVTAQTAGPQPGASTDTQEIRKLIDELQARERENYTMVLEGQRKIVDWWISFLAVITAILAIGGAFIPYLMGRKDRELIAQDKAQIERMLDEAKETVEQIHQHETEAKQHAEALKTYQSGQLDGEAAEVKEAVAAVQKDPTSDAILRLRAEAIAASQAKHADKAYALWRALTELDAADAIAHFNAGFWAHDLGEKSKDSESLRWLKQAGQHYSQAFSIKPNMHEAANNWGVALAAEAQAIAASDLDAARKLWQQAGDKYQQALNIKPDMHEAANNWGAALLHEAIALTPTDGVQADLLRDRAEKILLQHAEAAPGAVAYNLACIYGLRGDAATCLRWLNTCQTYKALPDCAHLKSDSDLTAVRTSPEFVEWLRTVCPQDQ